MNTTTPTMAMMPIQIPIPMPLKMTTSRADCLLFSGNTQSYHVFFGPYCILTNVTNLPSAVTAWINLIHRTYHHHHHHPLIVGLDMEWRRPRHPNSHQNNPAAVLQLCVDGHCLIFQILSSPPFVPPSLRDFFMSSHCTFVGVKVGLRRLPLRLHRDYGLRVRNWVDLGALAAQRFGPHGLTHAGLNNLALAILGVEVTRPEQIRLSGWDSRLLSPPQVHYACVGAFLLFWMGKYTILH